MGLKQTAAISRSAFLYWLLACALLIFSAWALWQHGMLQKLFSNDHSYLSVVITILFLLGQAHIGVLAWRMGTQTAMLCGTTSTTFGPVGSYLRQLRKLPNERDGRRASIDLLLSALERRLSAPIRNGWLAADTLLKLGLLGTVVGFVLMLGSVAQLEEYDLGAMQSILTTMSGGMRVALFTTLAGLSCGLLLGVQYHLLANQLDFLLADAAELAANAE